MNANEDRARTGPDARRGRLHRDQRGLVTAFLVRTIFMFVLLALVVEETGQVVLAQIHASNAAGATAQAAADDYAHFRSVDHAQRAAVVALQGEDPRATMTDFSIAPNGAVTVTVSDQAKTYFVQHLPWIKQFATQRSTETEIHSLA